MAGNIIPAIATTNAIIAGIIVLQALQVLRKDNSGLRNVHLQRKATVPINAITVGAPSPQCGVCHDTYAEVLCDPARVTLREVVSGILGEGEEEGGIGPRDVGVFEDKRMLADPDFDDNLESTLESLEVTHGKFITVVDEDEEWGTLVISIGSLPYVLSHPYSLSIELTKFVRS